MSWNARQAGWRSPLRDGGTWLVLRWTARRWRPLKKVTLVPKPPVPTFYVKRVVRDEGQFWLVSDNP